MKSIKKMNKFYKITLLTMLFLFLVGIATAGTVIDSDSITGLTDLSADNITVSYLSGFTQWGYDINSYGFNIWNGTQNNKPYHYLIVKNPFNSSEIFAINGTSGSIDYTGTTLPSTVAAALGNLSTERTWAETIIVRGNYSLDSHISISNEDYVNLHLEGKLILNNNRNTSMIRIDDSDHVFLYGGFLDGNKDNNLGGTHAIRVQNSSYVTVENWHIEDAALNGIIFVWEGVHTEHNTAKHNTVNNSGSDSGGGGIQLSGQNYSKILYNTVTNSQGSVSGAIGIELKNENNYCDVVGNIVYNGKKEAYGLGHDVNGLYGGMYCRFIDNIAENNIGHGFQTADCSFITVDGFISRNNTKNGMYIQGWENSTITNSIISSNEFHGIVMEDGDYLNCNNIMITNTHILNEAGMGVSATSVRALENSTNIVFTDSYTTIAVSDTLGIIVDKNNYGLAPYDFGINTTAPTPFGAGDEYYNSTDNKKYCYNGTTWKALY